MNILKCIPIYTLTRLFSMRLFFPLALDAVRDVVCKVYKEGVIFNIRVIMYM